MEKATSLAEQLLEDNLGLQQEVVKGLLESLQKRITQPEPPRTRQVLPPPSQEPSKPEGPTSRRRRSLDSHRAAPHELISIWPSVSRLLKEANVEYNERHVQEAENRGTLRLYGHGEGGKVEEMDGTQSGGPASPAPSEDSFSDASDPREDTWGYGINAYTGPNSAQRSQSPSVGGVKPDGGLDLDVSTIDSLWASFVKHVYIVHPIVDLATMRASVDLFISRYSPGGLHIRPDVTSFASELQGTVGSTMRYKGSQAARGDFATADHFDTERSPENAMVYLVLALGKITMCEWPSPADSTPAQPATNMKFIPGLAYYAKAAEIMGEQSDANESVHAQMFLLAGIYKGQLARVKESMRWVTKASAVVMALLDKYKLYNDKYWKEHAPSHVQHKKDQKPVSHHDSNLIVLLSWSCLHLEFDVLAELDLANSGILSLIEWLLIPGELIGGEIYEKLARNGGWSIVRHSDIILCYTARIFLKMRLELVQEQLYGTGCLRQTRIDIQQAFQHHKNMLGAWKDMLPPKLKWEEDKRDEDEWEEDDKKLPTNALKAMLRAEYWMLRHVIDRPFLDYAIHIMREVEENCVEDVAFDAGRNPRDPADIRVFKAVELMGKGTVLAACESCFKAAMEAADALDDVSNQMIMANVYGIAHA
jgi:hypothetical protein